ncbi:hypothetical protein HK100_006893 [Physocladia obscura]|uniref:Nucleotide-diphospho-sugar transferase n=1 Tax=Physocladia obscura TaxID=109957 RepID=A0AAD5X790_9FUNG|nr:hypothetical protein HK100_006893 [Physocladia obscura]
MKNISRYSESDNDNTVRNSLTVIIAKLERMLYPWLKPSYDGVYELQTALQKDSIGIVMTVGNKYFYVAENLIISLRTVLNVTIPVEVYYAGADDLSPNRINVLCELPLVDVVDIQTIFPLETANVTGWAIKAWALLASRFETVLFMDADITFLENPMSVLESPLFVKNRLLFFHDRKLHHPGSFPGIRLLKEMNPQLSKYGANLFFSRSQKIHGTTNEMESGFIVLDRSDTGVFFSLLLTAKMNAQLEREKVLYQKVHGDKESFWFATETLRVPYAFVPDYAGSIGIEDSSTYGNARMIQLCHGKLLHLNEDRNPFWFHAGSVLHGDYRNAVPPHYFGFSVLVDMVFHYDANSIYDDPWNSNIGCITQERWQSAKVDTRQAKLIQSYKNIFVKDIKRVD